MLKLRALLATLWAGVLMAVAGLAAPAAFAALERAQAGRYVAQLFEWEAQLSLACAVLLLLMERRLQRDALGRSHLLSAEVLLPLVALFCVVLGYYGIQPQMALARAGQGAWSFGQLHALSSIFFGVKLLAVMALAWRSMASASVQQPGL